MRRLNRSISVVLTLLILQGIYLVPAQPQQPSAQALPKVAPYKRDPSPAAVKWANEEMRKMSLDEKIGQLISVGVNATFLNQDSDAFVALKRQIECNHIGGIILFRGPVYESGVLVIRMQQFPGHGDTATDSHRGLPEMNVGRERLNAVEFVPFQAAVDAGVGAVMVGHIALPQIDATAIRPLPKAVKTKPSDTDEAGEIVEEKSTMPATMSPVMDGILRNDLNISELVVTAALSMSGFT